MADSDSDFEEFGHQVKRMAYSVTAFLERESGVPRRHACGLVYMPDRCNPWRGREQLDSGLSKLGCEPKSRL